MLRLMLGVFVLGAVGSIDTLLLYGIWGVLSDRVAAGDGRRGDRAVPRAARPTCCGRRASIAASRSSSVGVRDRDVVAIAVLAFALAASRRRS